MLRCHPHYYYSIKNTCSCAHEGGLSRECPGLGGRCGSYLPRTGLASATVYGTSGTTQARERQAKGHWHFNGQLQVGTFCPFACRPRSKVPNGGIPAAGSRDARCEPESRIDCDPWYTPQTDEIACCTVALCRLTAQLSLVEATE